VRDDHDDSRVEIGAEPTRSRATSYDYDRRRGKGLLPHPGWGLDGGWVRRTATRWQRGAGMWMNLRRRRGAQVTWRRSGAFDTVVAWRP
jgi:hypothetical protein